MLLKDDDWIYGAVLPIERITPCPTHVVVTAGYQHDDDGIREYRTMSAMFLGWLSNRDDYLPVIVHPTIGMPVSVDIWCGHIVRSVGNITAEDVHISYHPLCTMNIDGAVSVENL